MTDARLPERWLADRRILRLSDAHYRSFIQAMLYSVSNRTDGRIDPEDLGLIPNFAAGAAREIVAAGLWTALEHGWRITDFMDTQSSSRDLEVLANTRRREREKKQRQRAAKAAGGTDDNDVVPGDSNGDSTGGCPPGTPQARTGKARTGRQGQENQPQNDSHWPTPNARNTNGSEPYTPTAEESRRIDDNVRKGYE